jgi:DedD protein
MSGSRAMDRNRRPRKSPRLPLQIMVAALCLASFLGGVWVGRGQQQVATVEAPAPPKIAVQAPPAPALDPPGASSGTDNLTFFDTLSKGEQPPLGSGINLPPPAESSRQESTPPAQVVAPPVVKDPSPSKAAPPVAATGSYLVQAASFTKGEDAQALSARLRGKNHPVFVQAADLGERGTWYRVMIGPFENTAAAERTVARLQAEEKLSAVVRKR